MRLLQKHFDKIVKSWLIEFVIFEILLSDVYKVHNLQGHIFEEIEKCHLGRC